MESGRGDRGGILSEIGVRFVLDPVVPKGVMLFLDEAGHVQRVLTGFTEADIPESRKTLDEVYRERNQLVALLAALYPSRISNAGDADWPIVFIGTPEGQLSWHVPVEEARKFFRHVEIDRDARWDGHTSEEKYDRIARLVERIAHD